MIGVRRWIIIAGLALLLGQLSGCGCQCWGGVEPHYSMQCCSFWGPHDGPTSADEVTAPEDIAREYRELCADPVKRYDAYGRLWGPCEWPDPGDPYSAQEARP